MIGAKVTCRLDVKKVLRKKRRAEIRVINQAAFLVRRLAMRSIRRRKGPSKPGKPPHTQTKRLPKSILYDVARDKQSAIVGPAHHIIGRAGSAHEHGERLKQTRFPERPFMGPALEDASPKFPPMWGGQIA